MTASMRAGRGRPTAISDPRTAASMTAVSKPIAAACSTRQSPCGCSGACRPPMPEHPENRAAGAGAPDGRTVGAAGLPAYAYSEDAARALGHAARYRAWRERQQGRIPELSGLRAADARKLLAGFLAGCPAGGWLPAAMAAELLSCYQVPLVVTLRAGSEQEAIRAPAQLGRRVVLKAEAGGLVQPMPAGGVEVLIGVVQEPVLGPLVVLGLGWAATGVLGDHAARLAPLTNADADELTHAALLSGHRDTPPVDTAARADVVLRVSQLADDLPEVAELNLDRRP